MSLQRPEPQAIIIFGASGDLTKRKILPAVYNLYRQNLLPERFVVVGYARSSMDDEAFRVSMREAVEESDGFSKSEWEGFARSLVYISGEYADAGGMSELAGRLPELEKTYQLDGRRLYYCATPPSMFPEIAKRLREEDCAQNSRIVVEKPFGKDLESAQELNRVLHEAFDENQIFRIDHYLGKETVQNVLVLRFSNGMFEPIWNRRYVSSVQIDVAEDLGIGERGSFYEEAGAVRDILQNHMMQLLATLAMEPPSSFDAESIRDEKVKLLRSVVPIDPRYVIRGQYQRGIVNGQHVGGYRDEESVDPNSIVETFIALRLEIENWRWAGVPFFLRTGKRLARRSTMITVFFHDAPHMLFAESGLRKPDPNHLTIRIQPNEGITLTFDAKVPGPEMEVAPVNMDFDYEESFMTHPAEAYERLIHDAMLGDTTLFTRADEIEQSWKIVAPVLERTPPDGYPAGTWGPWRADELVAPGAWNLR